MYKHVDYSAIRGFNYTQSDVWTDMYFWENYRHDIVERDMGYAQRLNLNSARIFLTYSSYLKDKEGFLANVKDFVQTAWKHGISTSPIVYHGLRFHPDDLVMRRPPMTEDGMFPLSKTVQDPSCWRLAEQYFDDLYQAIGQEPGLLFWDISNEPGYMQNFVTWYDTEPDYIQTFRTRPEDMVEFRRRQELTWALIRHLCRYVKARDPEHDIGVGNCFIWDTEASGTAELVDVIIFHDYSATRGRLRLVYDMAKALGEKYHKPVLNNETCCLCRANPYDMTLEMCAEYGFGWYVFELMIGADGWNRVHGICYPDGTVRDPAVVAALFGFYRNRGENIVQADVNQEDAVTDLTRRVAMLMEGTRQNRRLDHSGDAAELLELCEYAANLLEAGELTPMHYPPTARVAAYRRQETPNVEEIKDWLFAMLTTLRQACHLV